VRTSRSFIARSWRRDVPLVNGDREERKVAARPSRRFNGGGAFIDIVIRGRTISLMRMQNARCCDPARQLRPMNSDTRIVRLPRSFARIGKGGRGRENRGVQVYSIVPWIAAYIITDPSFSPVFASFSVRTCVCVCARVCAYARALSSE